MMEIKFNKAKTIRPKHLERCLCWDKFEKSYRCYVYDDISKYWCTQATTEHDPNGDNHIVDYADYQVTDWASLPNVNKSSLPSNLDEAAEEYARSWYSRKYGTMPDRCRGCYAHIKAAVEFGAKWMAEQGVGITDFLGVEVTTEGTITDEIANNGLSVMLDKESVFKPGDKVIVKIRKK